VPYALYALNANTPWEVLGNRVYYSRGAVSVGTADAGGMFHVFAEDEPAITATVTGEDGHGVAVHAQAVAALLDQPLRATEPPGRPSHLPQGEQPESQPKGVSGGSRLFSPCHAQLVQALEEAEELILATDEIRRPCQKLEIVRVE